MEFVVVALLTLALVGIAVSALMTIGVALNGDKTG
jgi:hypothetical protein